MKGLSSFVDLIPDSGAGELTAGFFVFFVLLQGLVYLLLKRSALSERLSHQEFHRIVVLPLSQIHALVVNGLALYIMFTEDDEVLLANRLYGKTKLSALVCAFSCGYFAYDFFVVLSHTPVDYKFLLHAVVCGLAYWYTQAPYFQYYTIRFLLFELSTPLLNTRMVMVLAKARKEYIDVVGKFFGASFVACRLVYGLPLGYWFLMYLLELIEEKTAGTSEQADLIPPFEILYFSCFAVTSMCLLNLVWFLIALVYPPSEEETIPGLKIEKKEKDA